MWVKKYSKTYQDVNKEDIWQTWSDVNNWPKWVKQLEFCEMNDSFISGSSFTLKTLGRRKIKITLSHVIPNKQFTLCCKFFGASLYHDHELEETSDGLLIKNTITVTGILSFIWGHLIKKNVANSALKQMDILVAFTRSKNT